MWPWDHVAIAYTVTSLGMRIRGDRPNRPVAIAAVAGALGPDLVDKPLAWVVGVLPSGTSLAHSLLICLPVLAVLRTRLSRRVWDAVAAGYLSHLLADVAYGYLTPGPGHAEFLLWPLLPLPPRVAPTAVGTLTTLLGALRYFLSTPTGRVFVVVDIAVLSVTLGLWLADGAPGVRP